MEERRAEHEGTEDFPPAGRDAVNRRCFWRQPEVLTMFVPKYEPEQYRRWVTSFFGELAPDFFGWLEDINLEEYCLGDDTRKFCLDKGIVPFEVWEGEQSPEAKQTV